MAITRRRPDSNSLNPYHQGSTYAHQLPELPRPRTSRERRFVRSERRRHQKRVRRRIWQARGAGTLTTADRDVGLALVDFLGLDGGCFPSYLTLANHAGRGESSVTRALKKLAGLDIVRWITRKVAGDDGRDHQTSNLYRFPDTIEDREFIDREAEAVPATTVLLSDSRKTQESVSTVSTFIDCERRHPKPAYLEGEALRRARAALQRQRGER